MADNFIEFDAAGSGSGHVKGLPEIIIPQHMDDDDLVKKNSKNANCSKLGPYLNVENIFQCFKRH